MGRSRSRSRSLESKKKGSSSSSTSQTHDHNSRSGSHNSNNFTRRGPPASYGLPPYSKKLVTFLRYHVPVKPDRRSSNIRDPWDSWSNDQGHNGPTCDPSGFVPSWKIKLEVGLTSRQILDITGYDRRRFEEWEDPETGVLYYRAIGPKSQGDPKLRKADTLYWTKRKQQENRHRTQDSASNASTTTPSSSASSRRGTVPSSTIVLTGPPGPVQLPGSGPPDSESSYGQAWGGSGTIYQSHANYHQGSQYNQYQY